ncbi:neurexin-1-like isoform X2 [Clytia hemisphaerica]|uniref:Uncharacterized protein n=1 Tax=Clytia hemisphaerica TaxID=252671 RepID=A0A7M6DQ61_9CNID
MRLELISLLLSNLFTLCNSYTFMDKNKSFLQYKQWNMDQTGTLSFKFKTLNTYGLILYSDTSETSEYTESYIAMKLIYGQLEVTIQMGADDYRSNRRVKLGSNLNDLEWHTVEIQRDADHRQVTHVRLDSEAQSLFNDGEHDRMFLNSGLFFGGLPQKIDNIVDGSWELEPRLVGCIEEVKYKSGANETFTEGELLASDEVKPGCMNACQENVCPNGGKCINYFTEYRCDCIGTGFTGPSCQKEADIISFDGNTRLEINVPPSLRSTTNNQIALRFKTRESNGLIMAAWSKNDHLMIELKNTIIQLSIDLGGGYHVFRVNDQSFSDGLWHLIEITRKGRDVYLVVDRKYFMDRSTSGQFSKFDLREKLYIGGHPDVKGLGDINSNSGTNFKGCIQQVYFNELNIIYKVLHTTNQAYYLNGTKITNCSVTKAKKIVVRGNKDNKISESAKPSEEKSPTASSNSKVSKKHVDDESKTLSKNSVTWIVVGLVCGTLVLIVTVIVIVHNVKHRYSGVFLSSHVKEQYQKQLTPDGAGTLLFQPRNGGRIVIEPHLV